MRLTPIEELVGKLVGEYERTLAWGDAEDIRDELDRIDREVCRIYPEINADMVYSLRRNMVAARAHQRRRAGAELREKEAVLEAQERKR